MKYSIVILIFTFPLLVGTARDNQDQLSLSSESNIDINYNLMKDTIKIKVGDKVFSATLYNNTTAKAFKAMLPLTVKMTELNGNEKYFRLSRIFQTDASNPGTINAGDIMLWGSNTLVLFYETFSTSYSYTKIGKIDNPTGLASALGSGYITVTFE